MISMGKLFSIICGKYDKYILDKLERGGASIGKEIALFSPMRTTIDKTRPWLLSIGSYTKITQGCIILTHDYSLSVLRRAYGDWIGEGQQTIIGENCFLGMNSIILMGTRIGNNVIVGAGSVVHGVVPDNVVVAGNPAKIICTLEEHYKNRLDKTKSEAIACARIFYERTGKVPKPKDLTSFKWLFVPREKNVVEQYGLNFICSGDEPSEVEQAFYNSNPIWKSYQEFLDECSLNKD